MFLGKKLRFHWGILASLVLQAGGKFITFLLGTIVRMRRGGGLGFGRGGFVVEFGGFFEPDWTVSAFVRASNLHGERTFPTWNSSSPGELWGSGGIENKIEFLWVR